MVGISDGYEGVVWGLEGGGFEWMESKLSLGVVWSEVVGVGE